MVVWEVIQWMLKVHCSFQVIIQAWYVFFLLNDSRISLFKTRFPWLNIRVHHRMNTILHPLKIFGKIHRTFLWNFIIFSRYEPRNTNNALTIPSFQTSHVRLNSIIGLYLSLYFIAEPYSSFVWEFRTSTCQFFDKSYKFHSHQWLFPIE